MFSCRMENRIEFKSAETFERICNCEHSMRRALYLPYGIAENLGFVLSLIPYR